MIYFIQAGVTGPVKIGSAEYPKLRLGELQVGSHEKLVLRGVMNGGPIEERQLHKRFRLARIRGEWFRPSKELIDFVKSLKGTHSSGTAHALMTDAEIVHLVEEEVLKLLKEPKPISNNRSVGTRAQTNIARKLGISADTVRRKIASANLKLRPPA